MTALDWLYGPWWKDDVVLTIPANVRTGRLRNLTLEVENLQDLATVIGSVALQIGATSTMVTVEQKIDRGIINADQVAELHTSDQLQLVTTYTVQVPEQADPGSALAGGAITATLTSSRAELRVATASGATTDQLINVITSYLYRVGRSHPDWRSLRWLLAYAPTLAVAATALWAGLSTQPPFPVWCFFAAVTIAAVTASTIWANYNRVRFPIAPRHIRYRAESRAQTKQRRADEKANIRAGIIGAGFGAAATVGLTLLVDVLTRSG